MKSVVFRKALLALAVSGASLPLYAQTTIELNNKSYEENGSSHAGTVEITGKYIVRGGQEEFDDALEFNSVNFGGDLVLNANIDAVEDDMSAVDLSSEYPPSGVEGKPTEIQGNLINNGTIKVVGEEAMGILLDPAIVHGNVINNGTIEVAGTPDEYGDAVVALEISGQSEVHGNVINEKGALIKAEGEDATAIVLMGSEIDGRLINHGRIEAHGANADAIDVNQNRNENGTWYKNALVPVIENHGEIIATGLDADAIQIDGGIVDRIINTGTIQADSTGIVIGGAVRTDESKKANNNHLQIEHQGGLVSGGDAAINAEWGDVDLLWSGGKIEGNIRELGGYAQITNSVEFDGALIEVDENVRVGDGATTGHLELLATHTTIDGDLVVNQGSSVGLNLSTETDAAKPVLDVTKTAEFAQGSKLIIQAREADFVADGSSYRLVAAQQIIDKGLQVESSNQLLKVSDLKISSTEIGGGLDEAGGTWVPVFPPVDEEEEPGTPPVDPVDPVTPPVDEEKPVTPPQSGVIDVITKTPEEFRKTIAAGGGSQNAQAASAALSSVVSSAPVHVLNAFEGVTEAQAAQIVEQVTPETNGGATQAAMTGQSLISNVTGSRTSSIRGMSSGDSFKETGAWAQALYSDANQDLRDGVAGYNAYSRGIAIGVDGKLNDQLTLGVAYSYLDTDVNSKTGNKTEVEGHAFTLYAGYELGRYFVDANLTYGINNNEGERYVFGEKAKSDYDSSVLGVNVTGGYSYAVNENLVVEPRLATRYSRVDIDSYREKGAALALATDDQRYEVFELGAGVRVAAQYPLGKGVLEPHVSLMAFHDFAADQASSVSTFVLGGTPFVTNGAKPVRDSYEAGIGGTYQVGQFSVGLGYDYVGKSGFNADTVTAKLRYDF